MTIKTKHKNIEKIYRQLVWLGLLALVLLAGTYTLLINRIIINLSEREKSVKVRDTLESKLAELEARRFTLASKITPELAEQLGYQDTTLGSTFVAAGQKPAVASAVDNDS